METHFYIADFFPSSTSFFPMNIYEYCLSLIFFYVLLVFLELWMKTKEIFESEGRRIRNLLLHHGILFLFTSLKWPCKFHEMLGGWRILNSKHMQISQSPPIILTDKVSEEVSIVAKFDIANKWARRFTCILVSLNEIVGRWWYTDSSRGATSGMWNWFWRRIRL